MRWRNIGPFRGGRTRAVAGVPSQPNVFYIGAVNGGVWKTTDLRAHLEADLRQPADGLDRRHRSRALRPEHHLRGQRRRPASPRSFGRRRHLQVHRRGQDLDAPRPARRPADSADRHRSAQSRPAVRRRARAILTDPIPERGIYRSTDGGQSFEKVLYKNENIGRQRRGRSIPPNPRHRLCHVVGGARGTVGERRMERHRRRHLQIHRRRADLAAADRRSARRRLSQAYVAVSPSNPKRLFASVAIQRQGRLYRSDDAGETWTTRHRLIRVRRRASAAAICRCPLSIPRIRDVDLHDQHRHLEVHRRRQDLDRAARRARRRRLSEHLDQSQRSRTSSCWSATRERIVTRQRRRRPGVRGTTSPPRRCTTSTPTTRFPTALCSGQQESGSACISSRGNDGEITFRDWHPVAAEEYGYVVPDPLDPDIVFGGKLTRYDRRTGAGAERHAGRPALARLPRDSHRSRSCSRRSIRTCCTSPPTRCGRRATADRAGSRSART